MVEISGTCDERFEPVKQAFSRNFAERNEVGAAVSVVLDGEIAVDLWAGVADPDDGTPWEQDTMVPVFSTTKGLTAVCALLLWERGDLDLDAPVAEVWPEFGAAGKERVTTRHLLTHQGGLPVFEDPITLDECCDPDLPAERLAAQAPAWEPGTAHGYHLITFGWLVGEVVRRVSGRSVGRFLAEEISEPLDLDTHIGLPEEHGDRVATLISPRVEDVPLGTDADALLTAFFDPSSLLSRALFNPPGLVEAFSLPHVHRAEWPAAGGISTARSLAHLYGELAEGRVLSPKTFAAASEAQVDGPDVVLQQQSAFGLGFMLPCQVISYGPGGRGVGHPGVGGSMAFADTESRLGFAYVMNQMNAVVGTDARAADLVRATYEALGEG